MKRLEPTSGIIMAIVAFVLISSGEAIIRVIIPKLSHSEKEPVPYVEEITTTKAPRFLQDCV